MATSATLESVVVISQAHPPLGRYVVEAFKRQGIKAIEFNTDQNTWFDKWIIHSVNKQLHNLRILPKSKNLWEGHRWSHRQFLESQFKKLLDQHKPDLILAVRGPGFCKDAIAQSPALKFAWWVEPANRLHEIQADLGNFDWCYSMNEESLALWQKEGVKSCSYMPHMYSADSFFPIKDTNKSVDLTFVGNWNPRRQRYIDAAMEVTGSIVLYGKDWLKKNWTNPKYWRAWKGKLIQGRALNVLYNAARVVLNITQWESRASGSASGMNMRFFEVPATRSLLMTDRVEESDAIFKAGSDFIDFGDVEDFKQQLRFMLSDPERCAAISEQGYQTLLCTDASYEKITSDIIRRYAELRGAA